MNKRPILLATMMHTGTRFFVEKISRATGLTVEIMRSTTTERPPKKRQFARCHLIPEYKDLLVEYISLHDPLIISTIRNEEKTYQSWKKRPKNMALFPEHKKFAEWFYDKYSPLIVSVDSPDRGERLSALSEAIGVELKTNWKPVGAWKEK